MKILVIVCARNEEVNIGECLEAILGQSYKVQKIVVVDDRSGDRTGEIIDNISKSYPAVERVRISDQGTEEHSKRIPMAFNAGLDRVDLSEYDILSKVDADMRLSRDFFERLVRFLENDRLLGITGGLVDNEPTREVCGGNMVIRMECWNDIAENKKMPIVDSEDAYLIIRARMKNWKSVLLQEAVSHTTRPFTSSPFRKKLRQRLRLGGTAYRFGYHPVYLAGRVAALSVKESPYILTPIWATYGWVHSWVIGDKHDDAFRGYVRKTQWASIKERL